MFQPINTYLGPARRLPVKAAGHLRQPRDGPGVTPDSHGVAAVDGHDRRGAHGPFARRRDKRLQRGGDFARPGVFQRDDLAGRTVAVDTGGKRPDAADIVGEVGDDEAVGVAVRGERALRADERAQGFDRRDGVDMPEADDFGDELVLRRARAADAAGLRCRAVDRLDAIAAVRPRHRDEAVRTEGCEENLEIFAARQRPVGDHRHLAVDAPVDHEGASGDPRRILDEGANIGVAHVQRILGDRRRRCGGNERGGKHEREFKTHRTYCFERKMATGTTLAPRSTSSAIRAPGAS